MTLKREIKGPAGAVSLLLVFFFIIAVGVWLFLDSDSEKIEPVSVPVEESRSKERTNDIPESVPGDLLLSGYADPTSPPIEDLRKIHRVVTGYFSVIKEPSRFPIGGNADLAAALRGENPNREVFIRPTSGVFSPEGLLTDRWGSPLIVHPEAWKQLEIRSAGPDRVAYNSDDLIIAPTGFQPKADMTEKVER